MFIPLEERVKTQWQHSLHQGLKQGENRLLNLWKQGYTLEQVETLLAQESDKELSAAHQKSP
jgi:hypothetical protein